MRMQIIENPSEHQAIVENLIQKYGHSAWHNYFHFQNWDGVEGKNCVFHFEGRGAILARRKHGIWYVFSEVLAESSNKVELFKEFVEFCFRDPDIEKVSVEFEEDFRKDVMSFLKNSPWRACRVKYDLTCTVFDLARWNDELKGNEWKKLRNQKRRFYKDHQIEIVDSNKCSSADLKKIVEEWRKKRGGSDREYYRSYLEAIENHFAGTRFRRTLVVDSIPSTITAGWDIPNQPGYYYSAIGLHNYRCDYLGEASYLDDLSFLKLQGIRFANFGGGWDSLLKFKLKFKPSIFYSTYAFSIKRAGRS